MSKKTYSLDDIRTAADAKYGSTDIEVGDITVRLLNPLRLSEENRKGLMDTQKKMSADNEGEDEPNTIELFHDSLRFVAETDKQADALIEACGRDLAVLAQVFETYGEAAQVGEASASAS